LIKQKKKETGSFYTDALVAKYIAEKCIKKESDVVLEPSFGGGVFLDAAVNRFCSMRQFSPKIIGIELQKEIYNSYKNHKNIIKTVLGDFIDFSSNKTFNAVIGNPPYISLRQFSEEYRKKVLRISKIDGVDFPTSSSMWAPFVARATQLLSNDGCLGFVLPFEITYVRYAFPLWIYLSNNFSNLCICRIREDFFSDVDVETILFFAEGKGGTTTEISYRVFETIKDLITNKPSIEQNILISKILNMEKPFLNALLPNNILHLISELESINNLEKLKVSCKFKIGYVCGNKTYFHPSTEVIQKFNIPKENLIPCILNSKEINASKKIGIDLTNYHTTNHLFSPCIFDNGTTEYISYGEKIKVNEGYKCKRRNPWYITPNIETPDIILTVFGDIPRLLVNSQKIVVSNSLLSGTIIEGHTAKEIVCRWYNSLTLLLIEMTIHSLGGGSLVLIPGETDCLKIISNFPTELIDEIYQQFNAYAINHNMSELYQYGDTIILRDIYKMSEDKIQEIQNCVQILRDWRDPNKRRYQK